MSYRVFARQDQAAVVAGEIVCPVLDRPEAIMEAARVTGRPAKMVAGLMGNCRDGARCVYVDPACGYGHRGVIVAAVPPTPLT